MQNTLAIQVTAMDAPPDKIASLTGSGGSIYSLPFLSNCPKVWREALAANLLLVVEVGGLTSATRTGRGRGFLPPILVSLRYAADCRRPRHVPNPDLCPRAASDLRFGRTSQSTQ